jgi:hypothetical protein
MLTLTGELTISNSGGEVTVAKDATVSVSGSGKLDLAGNLTIAANANLEVSGLYEVKATGNGQNAGTITIKKGGKTLGNGGGKSGGTGQTIIEQGGIAANMQSVTGGGSVEVPQVGPPGYKSDDNIPPVLQLDSEGSKIILTTNNYALEGTATLNGLPFDSKLPTTTSVGNFMIGETENRKLTLRAGSVLNVKGNSITDNRILCVVVAEHMPGIVGDTGAQIVLGQHGYIDIYAANVQYASNISGLHHNFYDKDGNKEATNSLRTATYTWDGELNGGGWRSDKGQHGSG